MMPVVTNSLKAKMENCTVWESETARQFSPNPGMIRPKATPKVEEKAEPTKNVFGACCSYWSRLQSKDSP